MAAYISYSRVSTNRQGRSGLGLEAQTEAVHRHIAENDGNLIDSYVEVESGRANQRPELAKALNHAKHTESYSLESYSNP